MSVSAFLPAFALLGAPVPAGQAVSPPPVVATLPPRPEAAISVEANRRIVRTRGDRFEHFNRSMFRAHEKFDHAALRPAAMGYKKAVPKPLRTALRNIFSNLGEPIVFLNYVLQFKPGKAIETAGRFLINSTIGIGGAVDVAKLPGVKLPHRPNSLGNTLAIYGVKPGPYLFLPFIGPTTLRDLIGGQAEGLVLPLAVGTPFDRLEYQLPKAVITGLDTRAEADDDLNALFSGAVDPYATLRSVYLQNREAEIAQIRGQRKVEASPVPELGEPLEDPAGTHAAPAEPQSPTPELSDPLADPGATAPN